MNLVTQRRDIADAWARARIRVLLFAVDGSWNAAAKRARMDRTNFRRLARKVGAL